MASRQLIISQFNLTYFVSVIFIWTPLILLVSGCFSTSTASAPVPISITSANPCTLCTPGEIQLTPGNNANTSTPATTGVQTGTDACNILVVTCRALTTGGLAFMQFNVDQGGPLMPFGNPISATLNCVTGQWNYEPGNGLPNRVINEVNCVVSP